MNIINRFLGSGGGRPRKRSLHEKVDHIEAMVEGLTDSLDKIHVDMWDKLTAIQEQGAQRPSIVLGMPTEDGTEMAMFEPFEGFASYDDGGDESEGST